MKRKLLFACLGAYAVFLLGSLAALLFFLLGDYSAEVQNACLQLILLVFLLSALPVGVFAWALYLPLRGITEAAEKYTDGYPHPPLEYDHDNELGRLAASVNYLAQAVHNSEDSQRKFLSNISHDFRSPLTSIKGYVEAILDGTIPPEMQEKYLQIVVDETERLNKLTEGLLTLNTFDDRGVYLEMADFDLVPVIQSTVDLFEGSCQKKNLRIETAFFASAIEVHADRSKIQQVLYNLLDNAIKFSYSDSVLQIRVYGQKNRVFVSVKDHGEGIAKEHLPKIWDRFYKSDASRGRDKKGTGLGLSIVKEIIHAHGQNINVVSTQNVGTEFTFSLQKTII